MATHTVIENGERVVVADQPVLLVDAVEPLDNYRLSLRFSDGKHKIADLGNRLHRGVFRRLQNEEFFKKAHVKNGVVTWDDSLDIATEALYQEGVAVRSAA